MGQDTTTLERIDSLTGAVDAATGSLRGVYITFLLTLIYITLIVGSTTDMQLLLTSPVTLPILNVELPIVTFYAVVPWLVALLHFNLLLQFTLLANKIRLVGEAIETLADLDDRDRVLARLFPFAFTHMLLGIEYRPLMRLALAAFVWVTLVWLPLGLLLALQCRFLPYHDATLTWLHRIAVLTDLALLWSFFPQMLAGQRSSAARRGILERLSRIIRLLRRKGDSDTAVPIWSGFRAGSQQLGFITLIVGGMAFFVAAIPDEPVERIAAALTPAFLKWTPEKNPDDVSTLAVTHWLFDAPGAPLHRNLQLAEQVLSVETPAAELFAGLDTWPPQFASLSDITGLSLSGRDLRGADLRRARLLNTDLRGASLAGADLREATIAGVDLRPLDVTDGSPCSALGQRMRISRNPENGESKSAEDDPFVLANLTPPSETDAVLCWANLRGARLDGARILDSDLRLARLEGATLRGATLVETQLRGAWLHNVDLSLVRALIVDARDAKMPHSRLNRADFADVDLGSADLTGADLTHFRLGGASNLADANLSQADLTRADLRGQNLRGVRLDGATLVRANLANAEFRPSSLTGALLTQTTFDGTKIEAELLAQAEEITGIRIAGASLTGAVLPGRSFKNADLRGVDFSNADLTGTDFEYANLSGASLRNARLEGANFREAMLFGTDLSGARLWGASLEGASLLGGTLRDSDLRGANLSFHYLMCVDLRGALLAGAFIEALDGADTILTGDSDATPLSSADHQALKSRLEALALDGERRNGILERTLAATHVPARQPDALQQLCANSDACLDDFALFLDIWAQRAASTLCNEAYYLDAILRAFPHRQYRTPVQVTGEPRARATALLGHESCAPPVRDLMTQWQ